MWDGKVSTVRHREVGPAGDRQVSIVEYGGKVGPLKDRHVAPQRERRIYPIWAVTYISSKHLKELLPTRIRLLHRN